MADAALPAAIEAHYQKSNLFRVVHADGAFGGLSPRGLLNVAFLSERVPLPRRTTFPIVDGVPGPEQVVEVKQGLLREVEVNIVMDIAVAVSVHAWLGAKIEDAQKQLGISNDQMEKMSGRAARE